MIMIPSHSQQEIILPRPKNPASLVPEASDAHKGARRRSLLAPINAARGAPSHNIINCGLLAVPLRDYRKILAKQETVLGKLSDILAKARGVQLLRVQQDGAKDDVAPHSAKNEENVALDLLRRMLCPDPQHRISPRAALEHPWFAV